MYNVCIIGNKTKKLEFEKKQHIKTEKQTWQTEYKMNRRKG